MPSLDYYALNRLNSYLASAQSLKQFYNCIKLKVSFKKMLRGGLWCGLTSMLEWPFCFQLMQAG